MRYAPPYSETGAPPEALGTTRKEPSLSIVAFILVILGLGFLAVLWMSIALSVVFLVRGGLARTFGWATCGFAGIRRIRLRASLADATSAGLR